MQTFHALADPTRAHIVEMLAASGSLSAGEICRQFAASPPAVSQHLKVLKAARLVNVEAKAQRRIYSINRDGFREAQDWLKSITELWTERFEKLNDLLKSEQAEKK
jgi:DNA-binding transcriptional ArsR family regulator